MTVVSSLQMRSDADECLAPSLSVQAARGALGNRLRERLPELEGAVAARISGVAGGPGADDPEYLDGLRKSLSIALGYALSAIERGEERAPGIPPLLLAQARMAARHGVGLEAVLRRYLAGYSLVSEFVLEEAAKHELLGPAQLQRMVRGQSTLFDRLIEGISEEYRREAAARYVTQEQRRAERLRRLLSGEHLDTSGISYDFGGHHIAAVASGKGAAERLRELAREGGHPILCISAEADKVWIWIGGHVRVEGARFGRSLNDEGLLTVRVAFGEPSQGLNGWRLSHRQASAAFPFTKPSVTPVVNYRDVALVASARRDDLLRDSLTEMFLRPLSAERDGGMASRKTLRAYFKAERSVTSAAAILGVKRHTVTNRLRGIEALLGCSLGDCAPELEAAMRLEALG